MSNAFITLVQCQNGIFIKIGSFALLVQFSASFAVMAMRFDGKIIATKGSGKMILASSEYWSTRHAHV